MVWNKRTKEQFVEKLYSKKESNLEFDVVGEYINTDTPILIMHKTCGNKFLRKPEKLLSRGCHCPNCNPYAKTRRTQKEFEREVEIIGEGQYEVVGKYVNVDSKVDIKHKVCGNIWSLVATSFLNTGTRCPTCAKGGVRIDNEEFLKRLSEIDPHNEYIFLEEYKSYDEKLAVKHTECGYEYEVSPNKFFQGRRCPKCKETRGEKSISDTLDSLNIKYQKEKSFEGLADKSKLRFDFYVSLGKRFFLIEYDGIQHFQPVRWHSKMSETEINNLYNQTKKRDMAKNDFCKENNITLYRIAYTELENIEMIVNDIINKELSTTIPSGSILQANGNENGGSTMYTKI